MSSFEARRLASLEALIRAASDEQIVAIERMVAEVASVRGADVAMAQRTEVTMAARRCPSCGIEGAISTARTRTAASGSAAATWSVATPSTS